MRRDWWEAFGPEAMWVGFVAVSVGLTVLLCAGPVLLWLLVLFFGIAVGLPIATVP